MTIPPLRLDGTLPPGIHLASLSTLFAAYPALSPERTILNQVLNDVVNLLRQFLVQAPDMLVFVDGSYITNKLQPSDIDMVLRSDILDEGIAQQRIWQLPNGRFVDVFVDRYAAPVTNTIFDYFTHLRNDPSLEKGIIQLTL